MKLRIVAKVALFAILFTCPALAQPNGEHLVSSLMPEGFKNVPLPPLGTMAVVEFIPADETPSAYTKVLWATVFPAKREDTTQNMNEKLNSEFAKNCPNYSAHMDGEGDENGYKFSQWIRSCPGDGRLRKPEFEVDKIIVGDESIYTFKYLIRSTYSQNVALEAFNYLKSQKLCNNNVVLHRCPVQ